MLKMGNGGIELVNYWCMGTCNVFFFTRIYIYTYQKVMLLLLASQNWFMGHLQEIPTFKPQVHPVIMTTLLFTGPHSL